MTDAQAAVLALYGVPGVGAKMYARLIGTFGSAAAVFDASVQALTGVNGIGPKTAAHIRSFDRDAFVDAQRRRMEKAGARMLVRGEAGYPALLDAFVSAPPVLFVRGNTDALHDPTVAFVGTREPSGYGREMTRRLARGVVAAGWCIVSGMALGIDGEAHGTAIESGGMTVAVFGCGVDVIYPPAHRELAAAICDHGCLVSHFPMGTPGMTGNFPARNAVIVGLSRGTVVVEAPRRSGALITAELTKRAGRALFAVPGNADSINSNGTNALFGTGAIPAMRADDILRGLGCAVQEEPAPCTGRNTDSAANASMDTKIRPSVATAPLPPGLPGQIIGTLRAHGDVQVDDLCGIIGVPVGTVLTELTMLEMDGLVRQKPGKIYSAG